MAKSGKLLVAITGSIGSGKSTFASFLTEQGYIVLSADDISKEILARDPDVKKQIIREFGKESFDGNAINKKFLADKIFSNPKKLEKINSILHPRVREKINSLAKEYFKTMDFVFVEAALIFESKIEKMYDLVVLIKADKKIRMQRATKNNKISEKDFINRNKNQLDDEIKVKKSDIVFTNSGSKTELRKKANLLISVLKFS
jgi:dephospho-CoA kinase